MRFKQLLKAFEANQLANSSLYKLLQRIDKLSAKQEKNIGEIKGLLKKIDKLLTEPEISGSTRQKLEESLSKYRNELETIDNKIRSKFGAELDTALKPLGLKLSGNYPALKAGLFTFKLDFETHKLTLWFGPEQESLSECPLRISDIMKTFKKEIKELGTQFSHEAFTSKLKQAYQRAQGNSGPSVPINSVLPELAFLLQKESFYQNPRQENYLGYGRADFSYDLFRFGKASLSEGMQLTVAVKQYTRRRRKK